MPSDALALYAVVILLFPMACFFLSSPAFLLVRLDVPEVTQLLRSLFNGYFLVVGIAGTIAMVLFAVAGRPAFAAGAIAIAGFSIAVRSWLLPRMDAGLWARDSGVAGAVRQLRLVHVQGMLANTLQLVVVVASVSHIV